MRSSAIFLGTDSTGTSEEFALNNDRGVRINGGNNNVVGGAVVSKRNLISNNDDGVVLEGGATGNTLAGNFFGTDITGMAALENDAGIVILDAPAISSAAPITMLACAITPAT